MQPMGRLLIMAGGIMLLLGIALSLSDRIPLLGKLPGDLTIRKGNVQVHFPITTSIVLSAVISGLLWIISQFRGR
jgi:hypothetical protein